MSTAYEGKLDEEAGLDDVVGPAVARVLAKRGLAGQNRVEEIKQAASMSHNELLANTLRRFQPDWAAEFLNYRKAIPNPSGSGAVTVPNIPGLSAVPLSSMGEEGRKAVVVSREVALKQQASARRGRDRKPKVYSLADFINDYHVSTKFDLSEIDVQVVRRTAVVDPAAAARNLQTRLRSGGYDCTVQPGEYARSVKACRSRLHHAVEQITIAAPDVLVEVMGQTAIVTGPKLDNGRAEWTVTGPARVTPEVIAVARLAMVCGAHEVRLLFETDMIVCGVVLAAEQFELGPLEYHAGYSFDVHQGDCGTDGSGYDTAVREAASRVVPLVLRGRIVASAVRSSAVEAYANWHVLDRGTVGSDLMISLPGVGVVEQGCLHEVAADIWVVQHEGVELHSGAWLLREADLNEQAVMVYATRGGPEFSDPVRVHRKEQGSVITNKPPQVRHGVSGAALVALADGALLGVYRGSSYQLCSFAVVAPSSTGTQAASAAVIQHELSMVQTSGDSTYAQMARRGLADVVKKSVSSLRQLYADGKHVGYTVRYGNSAYTTMDCDVWSLGDVSGHLLSFERWAGDKFKCDASVAQTALGFVRLPRVKEKVYVVGCDHKGVYFSTELYVIRLASDSQGFWLSGDPAGGGSDGFVYAGALIVADSDGAVLGQYVAAMQTGAGKMSKCVGLVPRTMSRSQSKLAMLSGVVPGSLVELWDPGAVTQLLSQDPGTLEKYSALGRSVMASSVLLRAGENNLDVGLAASAVVSDSSWLGLRAFDCNFHHVVPLSGDVGHRPSEKLADVFRAFFGMLAVWQGQDVVEAAIRQLGWFDTEWLHERERLVSYTRSPGLLQGGFESRTSSPSPARASMTVVRGF